MRLSIAKAMRHTATDSSEPPAVAKPMGNSVVGKSYEVKYAPGTRTSVTARMLCKNDIPDLPMAQK